MEILFEDITKEKCHEVWIVDDDPMIRLIIHHKIKTHFPDVIVRLFKDASQAYQALDNQSMMPPPDLIILDENMPGMNGHVFCELVSKYQHAKPSIVLNSSDVNKELLQQFQFDFVIGYFEQKGHLALVDDCFYLGWNPMPRLCG